MSDRTDPPPPYPPYLPHLPYLAFFALLAVVFTWPLASILTSGVIGGSGDNLNFVWDFWWARTALAGHHTVFWTPDIFAPLGTSLATHTLIPIFSVGAAWLLPSTALLTLYNCALLLSAFLNFVCAYAAACSLTRDRPASAFAAITFGAAPFLIVRLVGHLNVLSAWGLPLVMTMAVRHRRTPSLVSALLLALALAVVAFTDYYFLIFSCLLVFLVMALSQWDVAIEARPLTRRRMRALTALLIGISVMVAMVLWIAATGGTDTTVAGIRLRMTDTFNDRVAIGFLIFAVWLVWKAPAARVTPRTDRPDPKAWRLLALSAGVLTVLLTPLLLAGVRLWQSGDYASQAYVWRNAPPGVDLATLFLGSQLHPLTGSLTARIYHHFGINPIEGAAWLGLAPMALVGVALTRLRHRADVQAALWIGGIFFVWSLGPYVRVLDYNTAVMLPETLLRYVPIAANARIPGRAFVVVQLMAALIGALALASLPGRARLLVGVAIAAVLIDYWPAPRPWQPVDVPPLYSTLKRLPGGVLLEVPLGIRDGFGSRGRLDHGTLFYQTVHEHPQMGGAVSRLSKRVASAYETDPIVGRILDLSEGLPPASGTAGDAPCQSSLACSVKYIVVDKAYASGELISFVADSFSLERIEQNGPRTLYAVTAVPACRCETAR